MIDSEKNLAEQLVDDVRRLPRLQVVSVHEGGPQEVDLEMRVRCDGHLVRVVAEVKAQVHPRDIPLLAHQFKRKMGVSRIPTVPVVAAPALSEGTRQALKEAEMGYWDAGGSLYLPVPGGLFYIDRPVPKGEERRLGNVFEGSSAQVVHTLLEYARRCGKLPWSWHVHALAKAAMVSPSTAHQTLEALEAREWVEKVGRGPTAERRVVHPGAMLDAWVEQPGRPEPTYGFSVLTVGGQSLEETVLQRLCHLEGGVWALTGPAAALRRAPFVTAVPVMPVRMGVNLPARLLDGPGFRHVDDGANLLVIQGKGMSPLLHRQEDAEGHWMVSDIQLYIDLWRWPMRGKEQAQHLRKQVLRF